MQEMLGKLGMFHEYAVKLVPRGNKKQFTNKNLKKRSFGKFVGKLKFHTLPVTSEVFHPYK